jgi:hypothetical protein
VKALGNARLEVSFANGVVGRVDFRHLPHFGDITLKAALPGQLADDEYLSQVAIGEDGFWLEWPGELDFGADQIWQWSQPKSDATEHLRKAS